MKQEILNERLLAAIREKIPDGVPIANELTDILYVGRESVYRRIRGDVPFTFYEIALIAKKLNISLDSIVEASDEDKGFFRMANLNFVDPDEADYSHFEHSLNEYKSYKDMPDLEYGSSCNVIPKVFLFKYRLLTRFSSYKWMFQNGRIEQMKPFGEVDIPERLYKQRENIAAELRNIHNSFFVCDRMVFTNFVNEVKAFAKVQLISDEEILQIKQSLLALISEMEDLSQKGMFENGNYLNLYISNLNFESTYGYMESGTVRTGMVNIFTLNMLFSNNEKIVEAIKNCVQSMKQLAMQISGSGGAFRIQYFKEQRAIVNTL